MRVGISTACFYPTITEKAINTIDKLGFKKIEFFANSEAEYNTEFISQQREKLDSLGIEVVSFHSYSTAFEHHLLFSEYGRRREDGFRIFKSISRAASMLGAKYISFHGITTFLSSVSDSHIIETYKQLIDIAGEQGIHLTQENVSYCRSSQPDFLNLLKSEFSGEELSFTLDIKQAYRAGIDVYKYLDAMGDRIKNIHINDNDEENSCLLPGEGSFDYEKFFKSLYENNYNGDFIIEVYANNIKSLGSIVESKNKLENLLT